MKKPPIELLQSFLGEEVMKTLNFYYEQCVCCVWFLSVQSPTFVLSGTREKQ